MTPAFLQYLIFAVNIVLLILLTVVFFILKKENEKLDSRDSLPDEKIIKNALKKSDNIVNKATSYAQKILSIAQSKRLNLISGEKLISKQIVDTYRKDIEKLEEELREKFDRNTATASNSYGEFIDEIEKKIQNSLEGNRKMLEEKASSVIDTAGKSLTEFTQDLEKTMKSQIENEMVKAKMEIEQYKNRRNLVLDEKIVDILEEIMSLTLEKKLSLADRSEFIYKALEEAKKSHAIQ